MKKFLLLFFEFGMYLFLNAQIQNASMNFNVQELSLINWDSQEGITYKQVPGANLGATSFEVMNNDRIAFLCNSTDEILLIDKISGKPIKRFHVTFSPRDFAYKDGYFFVLTESQVIQYDENGNEINTFSFPQSYVGVERIARFGNSTYLLLPNGNSLMIESNELTVRSSEQEGWITGSGNFIVTKIIGNNSYSAKVIMGNGTSYEKVFSTVNKVAGVFVVGSTNNNVVLDVQTFISENPISVERFIVEIEFSSYGLGPIIAQIRVPDCYYVLSNKDFLLMPDGTIYNMITAPQGVYIFAISETKALQKSASIQGYPSYINKTQYHFNDHLIKVEEK